MLLVTLSLYYSLLKCIFWLKKKRKDWDKKHHVVSPLPSPIRSDAAKVTPCSIKPISSRVVHFVAALWGQVNFTEKIESRRLMGWLTKHTCTFILQTQLLERVRRIHICVHRNVRGLTGGRSTLQQPAQLGGSETVRHIPHLRLTSMTNRQFSLLIWVFSSAYPPFKFGWNLENI